MIVYTKICAICQKKFYATRLNKTYCSKTCSNRTRYLPKELVAQLVSRNSKYMLKANKYVAMVTNEEGIEESIGTTVTDQAIADLMTVARVNKREKDQKDEKEKQKSLESTSGFAEVIDATVHITTENDLTLSSIKQMVEIIKDNPTIVHPKKYKIKSLQRTE